jgi:hypothetical protein
MSSLTNYAENQLAVWLFTNGAVARPTQWFIALFTSDPGEAGGGAELSGSGYARQAATFSVSGNIVSNTAVIEFQSTGNWPAITHVAVMTAATGGQMLSRKDLTPARDPETNDIVRIAAGAVQVVFD